MSKPSTHSKSSSRSKAAKRPWYAEGIRFGCTGCGGCCKSHGEYSYVYVSDEEAAGMASILGISVEAFDAKYALWQKEDGQRHLRFVNGACPFLKDNRCEVYESRPVQCRTWPFWRRNLKPGVWKEEIAPFTPGVGQGRLYSSEEIEALAREDEASGLVD